MIVNLERPTVPPVEWIDRVGDVWQEHPTDPQQLRLARFADGKTIGAVYYLPRVDVDRQWGKLTQPDHAPITVEEVAEWQVDDERGGTGEVEPDNYSSEVRHISEMNRQRTSTETRPESPEASKIGNAAAELENLTVMMRQAVLDLRKNSAVTGHNAADPTRAIRDAYARVYYLRRELGRVVTTLGIGVPAPSRLRDVEKTYRALIQD